MKNIVLVLFISALYIFGKSTGKISGTVTDSLSGKPVHGASVVLQNTLFGSSTDLDGDYVILNIEPGLYKIQASSTSSIGQLTKTIKNVKVFPEQTTQVNIKLEPRVLFDGQTRRIQPISNLPFYIPRLNDSLYVFAHYLESIPKNKIRKEFTRILLINNTKKEMILPTNENDNFFKLETQDEVGNWKRAEPTYSQPFAANSFEVSIPPGYYFMLKGYVPVSGEFKQIRYKYYGPKVDEISTHFSYLENLFSNSFTGLVSQAEIKSSNFDDLAIETVSFDSLAKFLKKNEAIKKSMEEDFFKNYFDKALYRFIHFQYKDIDFKLSISDFWNAKYLVLNILAKNDDSKIREILARQLGIAIDVVPIEEVVGILEQLKKDEDEEVKRAAVEALNQLNGT